MSNLFRLIWVAVVGLFRSRAGLRAEVLILRHQLNVLRRKCLKQMAFRDGHDIRALQHYMGHKNIMHTVRHTEKAPDRFTNFWKD